MVFFCRLTYQTFLYLQDKKLGLSGNFCNCFEFLRIPSCWTQYLLSCRKIYHSKRVLRFITRTKMNKSEHLFLAFLTLFNSACSLLYWQCRVWGSYVRLFWNINSISQGIWKKQLVHTNEVDKTDNSQVSEYLISPS